MRRTIFTETTTYRRAVSRATLLAAGAALVGGCTMTPWTDSYQPSSAPQPTRQAGVLAGYYRVNPGDTLPSIAAGFGQRVQDLASWNRIAPTDMLTPGQVLRVSPPPGATVVTSPVPSGAAPSVSALPDTQAAQAQTQTTPLAWPAQGTVTSRFIPGKTRGITITSTGDKTVRAAAPGRVVYAGTGVAKYGPLVILKHESGLITAYGHNGQLLVNEGDAVTAGQPIAEMATNPDGRASFDFEVRQDGKPADPITFLPRNN
ncbi:peptidoglycan DD-metalloendopeptidase family protein [Burkholderia sp. 22PA0106]|uniref:peptidoglycan DD-metalloendopeptidase family protein n=1 Tax=Burkholderia sp. 22PA0106 TaxID=3237371 RepID=UPI0039C31CDB